MFLMNRFARLSLIVAVVIFAVFAARAADDVVSAVHGTVTKTDAATKTIAVKTADGTVHTFKWTDKTVTHGTEVGATDTFHGVKEGSEVAVHYTVKGADKSAVEVDRLGKDGVKSVDGVVTKVGEGGKTVTVKTADGTEKVFTTAGRDTAAAAKDLGKGADKTGKVTVYYTEEGGKAVAHFFQKL
jgi:hypothetical protein